MDWGLNPSHFVPRNLWQAKWLRLSLQLMCIISFIKDTISVLFTQTLYWIDCISECYQSFCFSYWLVCTVCFVSCCKKILAQSTLQSWDFLKVFLVRLRAFSTNLIYAAAPFNALAKCIYCHCTNYLPCTWKHILLPQENY